MSRYDQVAFLVKKVEEDIEFIAKIVQNVFFGGLKVPLPLNNMWYIKHIIYCIKLILIWRAKHRDYLPRLCPYE